MVSFLSILDQATSGFGVSTAGFAPPAEGAQADTPALDEAGLNDLLTQLIQSLQQIQPQLPPEIQPQAQETLDLLAEVESTEDLAQSPDLKALFEQLTPALRQALQPVGVSVDASVGEGVAAATPKSARLSDVPVPQKESDALIPGFSNPVVPQRHLERDLKALAQTVQQVQKTMGTSPSAKPLKAQLAKLTQLVEAIQANPQTPAAVAESLKPLEATLEKEILPVMQQKALHLMGLQEALGNKLAKALEKAPEALKPLIEETLTQLAQANLKSPVKMNELDKTVHPLQLELDWHRAHKQAEVSSASGGVEGGESALAMTDLTAPMASAEGVLEPAFGTEAPASETSLSAVISSERLTSPSTSRAQESSLVSTASSSELETLPPHLQVVQEAKMTFEAGRKQVTMQLNPHQLGQVNLKITSHANNQVSIRLMTQTLEAHAALDQSITQLVESLKDQGVQIRDIQIVQAGQDMVSSTTQSQSMSQFDANTPEQRENRFDANHNQQHQQSHGQSNPAFAEDGSMSGNSQQLSNPFTDEGASMGEEIASSQIAFDTDVEGEEVTLSAESRSASASTGIDIRI